MRTTAKIISLQRLSPNRVQKKNSPVPFHSVPGFSNHPSKRAEKLDYVASWCGHAVKG